MGKAKAQYFVREYTDKPVTKKEFLRLRDEEMKRTYVSRQRLLESKQYTKHQLDAYEKQGLLTPIKHKGKVLFPKDQLIAIIDNEPSQRKMPF
jgi:hypothetical protein